MNTSYTHRPGALREPVLNYRNITKRYGQFQALHGISLDVFKGEVVCLIGPSGSGKSTVLRCTNALEAINSGEILVNGIALPKDDRSIRKVRQRMGMVFQNFELFPHKNTLQNVAIALTTVLGMNVADANAHAARMLEKVGLSDKMENYPANLSGGQQQRVAIARALAMQPEVMLFDEPTSALDPETIGEVLSVMKTLAEEGMTMVVCSHEVRFARQVASRVVLMADGEVVEEAPPQQFFSNPQHERSKQFLSQIS